MSQAAFRPCASALAEPGAIGAEPAAMAVEAILPLASGWYARSGKRALDLLLAVLGLTLLAPLLAVIAFAVRLDLGRPVLFRQERIGRDDRIFMLLKFRSMREELNAAGEPLPDSQRLTCLGLFLRRWSLDELPQLVNVLRGELSLVGPRPLLVRYLPRYSQRQRYRHRIRPGLTGWAQVNGRNLLGWEARFEHDLWYLQHCSFPVDVKILVLTLTRFLGRDDTAADGNGVEEFQGQANNVG